MHGCGRPMQRVGEDISEELDIVPAQYFVHRHIYGKWACRCCQILKQEPAAPRIIDGGIPAAGLVAHTMISHYVDHLPYYRLETVADEVLRRMARIWRLEREFAGMDAPRRLAARQELAKPLWQDLYEWLQLERARVADGGSTAKAID